MDGCSSTTNHVLTLKDVKHNQYYPGPDCTDEEQVKYRRLGVKQLGFYKRKRRFSHKESFGGEGSPNYDVEIDFKDL